MPEYLFIVSTNNTSFSVKKKIKLYVLNSEVFTLQMNLWHSMILLLLSKVTSVAQLKAKL